MAIEMLLEEVLEMERLLGHYVSRGSGGVRIWDVSTWRECVRVLEGRECMFIDLYTCVKRIYINKFICIFSCTNTIKLYVKHIQILSLSFVVRCTPN